MAINIGLSSIGNALKSTAGGAIGAVANDVGNWTSSLFGGGNNTAAPTTSPNYGTGKSSGSSGTNAPAPDLSAVYNKAYQAALAAAQQPVPRLADLNLTSVYNKATQMATAAVNPVYQQKLNDFIAQQKQTLAEQQGQATSQIGALNTAQQQLEEDTATQQARTAQDTASNIGNIQATQAFNARNEGTNFDTAQAALKSGVNAAGLATSGLGQQQVKAAQTQFTNASNEEVRQENNSVDAANILMNRTFQDLNTKETRGAESTTTQTNQINVDLQNFIKDQSLALTTEKHNEELQKQADIAQKAQGVEGQLVNQWLQSLKGQGYSAQEIALAAQTYK